MRPANEPNPFVLCSLGALIVLGGLAWEVYTKLALIHAIGCVR